MLAVMSEAETCKRCGGTGMVPTRDSDDDGVVTLEACSCPAGAVMLSRHATKWSPGETGNVEGYSTGRRMAKIAFDTKLDHVLSEIRAIDNGDGGSTDMSYYEAACRALLAQALYGIDEGTRLRAIQYIIDRKLGKAAQSVQVGRTDDYDPLEGMSAEEKKELLAIALAG